MTRCRRRVLIASTACLLGATVGACGGATPPLEDPAGGPSSFTYGPAPLQSPPPPPAAFTQRSQLASCGAFDLEQGESIPDDAWDCLDEAFDTGAELSVASLTVEGDTFVRYYRVGPDIEGVEIFHDMTLDRYGPRTWIHEICSGVSIRTLTTCTEV